MKQSIIYLLDDASKKMSGYAALFNYRMMNLSVKAHPEALLSVKVMYNGSLANLEDVGVARNAPGREDQFEIYPLQSDGLAPLMQGLMAVHPDYKLELKDIENAGDDEEAKFILATMPVVDDARHEVLKNAVAGLSDECDAKIQATFTRYSALIPVKLAGASEEEIKEAQDAMQEVYDNHKDLCKQFREEKEKEIEDAYQEFQAQKAEMQAKIAEKQAALGDKAGTQMKWSQDDE